jgi:hypothetical protein
MRIKPFLISIIVTISTLLVVRCTTLNRPVTSIEGILSSASTQLLQNIGNQLKRDVKPSDLVNQFANSDLGLLKKELLAVNQAGKDLGIPLERTIHLTPAQQQEVQQIIAEVAAKWTNKYGWMELHPSGPTSGYDCDNPALYTSLYLWVLWRIGMLNDPLRTQYANFIPTAEAKNQLQPGLYDRVPISFRTSPTSPVMNFSHDESLGLLAMDFLYGYKFGFARDQRTFGDAHYYDFPNALWSSYNTFNRVVHDGSGNVVPPYQVYIEALFYGSQAEDIKRAGNVNPSFGSDVVMCAGLLSMASNDAVNAVLSASIHKGESDILDGCIYQFNQVLQSKYPGNPDPMTTLLKLGFAWINHPLARLGQYLSD